MPLCDQHRVVGVRAVVLADCGMSFQRSSGIIEKDPRKRRRARLTDVCLAGLVRPDGTGTACRLMHMAQGDIQGHAPVHPAFRWNHPKAERMLDIQKVRASLARKTAHIFARVSLERVRNHAPFSRRWSKDLRVNSRMRRSSFFISPSAHAGENGSEISGPAESAPAFVETLRGRS